MGAGSFFKWFSGFFSDMFYVEKEEILRFINEKFLLVCDG